MATSEDLNGFLTAVNAPAPHAVKEARRKSMNLSMLAKAQEEDSSDESVTGKRSPASLRPSRPSRPIALALRACVRARTAGGSGAHGACCCSLPHGAGTACGDSFCTGPTTLCRGDTETMLPSAKKVGKVQQQLNKGKAAMGKAAMGKGARARQPALTGPGSSVQKWGTVYDPTLSWGKMPMVCLPRPTPPPPCFPGVQRGRAAWRDELGGGGQCRVQLSAGNARCVNVPETREEARCSRVSCALACVAALPGVTAGPRGRRQEVLRSLREGGGSLQQRL